MWCSRVHKLFSAHVDGELSPADVCRVEEHLAACERCSREHVQLRRVTRLTALVPEEDLPTGLQARILASLNAPSQASAPRLATRRVGGGLFAPWAPFAMAGMATVAVAGYVVVNSRLVNPAQVAQHTPSATLPREASVPPAPLVVVRVEPQGPVESATPPATQREHEATERAARLATREARSEAQEETSRARVSVEEPPDRQDATEASGSRLVVSVGKGERRAPRVQPAAVASSVVPREKRAVEAGPATAVVSPQNLLPLPAEPMTVATSEATQPQPVTTGMEGDGVTRMAGATMDSTMPAQEEDGLNTLRMYLQERNQDVPQPTLLPNPQRRMRKL